MKKFYTSIVLFLMLITGTSVYGNKTNDSIQNVYLKNAIELSPISPFVNIYAATYSKHFTEKDAFITGISYMKIKYETIGNTNAVCLIAGYRRNLWRNLHIEYQLWPTFDNFYEKNEGVYYKSFDLWNEFRLGYQFNYKIANIPLSTTIQWPFGFGLYASNKPQSFKDFEKDNRFFYQFPLLFIGYRF